MRRHRGSPPRRHSPFPSVSSSSSSSVSCGFPRFRSLLRPRCSVPGSASPDRLSHGPSIRFKSVKIESIRTCVQAAAPAACRSTFRRSPAFLRRPSRPAPASAVFSSGSDDRLRPPSGVPVHHPASASCSARLLFILFMVRISGFRFVSFRSTSAQSRLFCPVRFLLVSADPVSFALVLLILFRSFLSLIPCCARSHAILFILISRILYTGSYRFQMDFLSKNMCFLKTAGFFCKNPKQCTPVMQFWRGIGTPYDEAKTCPVHGAIAERSRQPPSRFSEKAVRTQTENSKKKAQRVYMKQYRYLIF